MTFGTFQLNPIFQSTTIRRGTNKGTQSWCSAKISCC